METKENTLYVSDLDGTLLDADSQISSESRRLLNESVERGALFTIATARTPATVATLLKGIRMPLDAIVMTGAARWNCHTGRYSHIKYFPPHLASEIMRLMLSFRYPSFVYTLADDMIRIYRIGPMTPMEKEFIEWRVYNPYKRVEFDVTESDDVWRRPLPDTDKVVLFYSLQPMADVEAFYPILTHTVPQVNALHYIDREPGLQGLATLEIFAPEATKAIAVREMAEELGVGRTVVFGDNVNDLSMMRVATLSVAPANAIEEVKNLADEIIPPNTNDSVARYINSHTPS